MRKFFTTAGTIKCTALLLAVAVLFTGVMAPTLAYIVTQTGSLVNTFISGLAPEGELVIHKTVRHPFGTDYDIPENLTFSFLVELGADYADKTVYTSDGPLVADETGAVLVQVRPNDSLTIRELLAGIEVKVTELQSNPGFYVVDGPETRSFIIPERQGVIASYVNEYTPSPVSDRNLTVTGEKVLEGRDWMEGDSFTFAMDYRFAGDPDSLWVSAGTATVTYDAENESFNLFDLTQAVQALTFDRHGVYAFRVYEQEGTVGGITYDDVISYFDIRVADRNMDGFLEIDRVTGTENAVVSMEETTWKVAVSFLNRYAPEGSAEITLPIEKTLEDQSGQGKLPEGFSFELLDEQGTVIKTSSLTSAAGETGIRLVYGAEDAGSTFVYTLREVGGGETVNGMIYDGTTYPVTVQVIDNLDGTICVEADVTSLSFHNIYDPLDATVKPEGTKELTGRELADGEFRFCLYETGPDFLLAEGAVSVSTGVNAQDGQIRFEDLVYGQVGRHYYVLSEDASQPLGGVVYDDVCYRITVNVTDEQGVLTAVTQVTNEAGEETPILFQNAYVPTPVSIGFTARKLLEGAELTEDMFRFLLFRTDNNFSNLDVLIQNVTNEADGTVLFSDLTFSRAGTYYYLIAEEADDTMEGMTFDDTLYAITVTVEDDGLGVLTATYAIAEQGGGSVEEMIFENVYTEPVTEPSTEPTEPSTEPTEPSTEPTEPSTEPSTEPTEPSTEPTEPTTKPSKPGKPSKPVEPPKTEDRDYAETCAVIAMCSMMLLTALLFLEFRRITKEE